MFKAFNPAIHEVGRLTSAGRLIEATSAIQRMLARGGDTPEVAYGLTARTIELNGEEFQWADKIVDKVTHHAKDRGDKIAQGGVPPRCPSRTGQFLSATFTSADGSRPYKVYIPSGYREDRPMPLIVMLHGCTQSPDDFAAGTGMNELAERKGMVVAYPSQTSAANPQKCWNWFKESDQHRDSGEPSLIAGITRTVMANYAIDPNRVYAAGLSAGGATAVIMGQTYPDLYAAIGVHSGLACGAAKNMQSAFAAMHQGRPGKKPRGGQPRVPVIIFHGDSDMTVVCKNGDFIAEQLSGSSVVSKMTETGKVPGGHSFCRTTGVDTSGVNVVEQWTIHGAGHAWSGGKSAGSYTDPHGPNATEEMVRFFEQHAKI